MLCGIAVNVAAQFARYGIGRALPQTPTSLHRFPAPATQIGSEDILHLGTILVRHCLLSGDFNVGNISSDLVRALSLIAFHLAFSTLFFFKAPPFKAPLSHYILARIFRPFNTFIQKVAEPLSSTFLLHVHRLAQFHQLLRAPGSVQPPHIDLHYFPWRVSCGRFTRSVRRLAFQSSSLLGFWYITTAVES